LTLEGPDGSGKSTQARRLAARFRAEGREVLESVEPGGTPIGKKIRAILLDPANQELCPTAELLLMFAARSQNVEQWIEPALAQGKIVISDRFTDSTLAYQGAGRGLGEQAVRDVDRIACRGLVPDLTFVIDIDAEIGLARANSRNRSRGNLSESRIDAQAIAFHRRVREAYHELAASEPARVRIIDGNASEEVIAEQVWSIAKSLL